MVKMMKIGDVIGGKYEIPDFQRDYAWKFKNLKLMLDDIRKAAINPGEERYILGSIVVHDDKKRGKKIVVDGQQRLTSLTIVLKALGKENVDFLDFENRSHVKEMLEGDIEKYQMKEGIGDNDKNQVCEKIYQMYVLSKQYIETLEDINKEDFCDYLLNKVCFVEKTLSVGSDIQHSFEVLNTAGEQLKKEDIAKAKLIAEISALPNLQNREQMWDLLNYSWLLCYDIENVHEELHEKYKDIFKAGDLSSLHEVMKGFITDGGESVKTSLKEVVGSVEGGKSYSRVIGGKITDYQEGEYSVCLTPYELIDTALEDSLGLSIVKIVNEESHVINDVEKALRVIKSLLLYRIAFDKYVDKRHKGKWDWDVPVSLDENKDRFIKIESMMAVSGTEASKEMVKIVVKAMINDDNFDAGCIIMELEEYAVNRVRKIFEVDGKDSLNRGTGTNHFIFHWLDYLLWLKRPDEIKEQVDKFNFKETTSVEHFMPRNLLGREGKRVLGEWENELNNFGNLALITPSSNSRQNNSSPKEKARIAADENKDPESLKYVLMMEIARSREKEGKDWKVQDSIDHGNKMRALLEKPESIIEEGRKE